MPGLPITQMTIVSCIHVDVFALCVAQYSYMDLRKPSLMTHEFWLQLLN